MAFFNPGYLRLKAIDLIGGLKICKVLKTLKTLQYMPAAELDSLRYARLNELFAIAKQSAPYYSSYNTFESLPYLTKGIIMQNPEGFLSSAYKGKLFKKATGGSTGVTLSYYGSVMTQSYLWGSLIHSWKIAGYKYGDPVAFIAGSALIKSNKKHRIFYKFLNVKSYDAFSLDETSINNFLDDLKKNKTSVIFGYAMVMNVIAEYISHQRPDTFPHLKGIVCTSEVLTDTMRANIQHAFKVKVYNQYGCNEAGIMSFECEHQQLHLISSRTIYGFDEEGTFISTDLENDAFFFMKYNTGDIVEFSDKECTCGRKYPVISKILGRSNDIIRDMNNKVLHSNIFNIMFRKDASIKQFQILFDKETISFYLRVDNTKPEHAYDHLLEEIKKILCFREYKLIFNAPFIKAGNAKHRYIINTSNQPA